MKPVSPLWYVAALFVALIGWVVGTTVAAGAWDSVRDAAITPVSRPLDAEGQSVAVFTDVVQPERKVTCQAADAQHQKAADKKKKEPVPIPASRLELVVTDDGNEWHLIAFEPDGRNGMDVRCTPQDKRTDNATYATAVVDGFTHRANLGKGIGIIGTTIGVAVGLWTFIARRREKEHDDAST